MTDLFSVSGKTVFISGGSRGIGAMLAEGFVNAGAKVIISARKAAELHARCAHLQTLGDCTAIEADLSSQQGVEALAAAITSLTPRLDILINNAGTNVDNLSLRMKEEEWKKVIDINLTSTFLLSKYAIKKMLKSKFGRIVNITSVVGHTGNLGQSNYAASKAGIIGMSKSFAIEYAKKNITINCVSPGFIVSDMTMNIAEKVKLYLTSRIPMGKLGTGEDVSNCVAFLSSEQASYVTGETIHVNGGMYMS